jgi:hypothetical protein
MVYDNSDHEAGESPTLTDEQVRDRLLALAIRTT